MKLAQIASALNARLENGSPDIEITGVAGIKDAGPGQLTFVANPKYAGAARTTRASAVIVTEEFPAVSDGPVAQQESLPGFRPRSGTFLTDRRAMSRACIRRRWCMLRPRSAKAHTSGLMWSSTRASKSAGTRCCWRMWSSIAASESATTSLPTLTLWYAKAASSATACCCRMARSSGPTASASPRTTPATGTRFLQPEPVVIEDDVEIQANSCVDRASVEKTRIGRGTKIDNLVQVGHGSRIGEHSLLASQVGLAGSTDVGNNVILTGQVGVVGHCKIGDGAIVTPQSGVAGDIEAGAIVSGAPAVDHKLVAEVFGAAEQAAGNRAGGAG